MSDIQKNNGNLKKVLFSLVIIALVAIGGYKFWFSPEARSDAYVKDGDALTELSERILENYLQGGSHDVELFKKKTTEAIVAYDKAIEVSPKNVKAYVGRAHINNVKADNTAALDDCRRAIELDPSNVEAYIQRGIAYKHIAFKGNKDYKYALDSLDAAIECAPQDIVAHMIRGKLLLNELHDEDKALEDFTAIINNKNADALFRCTAYHDCARIHANQKKYELAVENFSKALDLLCGGDFKLSKLKFDTRISGALLNIPSLDVVYFYRGSCYSNLGDFKNAVADFTRAIEIKPENFLYRTLRANANLKLGDLGDMEQVILDLTAEIDGSDKKYPYSYERRAAAYRKLGKIDLAEADEAKAKELDTKQKETEQSKS